MARRRRKPRAPIPPAKTQIADSVPQPTMEAMDLQPSSQPIVFRHETNVGVSIGDFNIHLSSIRYH